MFPHVRMRKMNIRQAKKIVKMYGERWFYTTISGITFHRIPQKWDCKLIRKELKVRFYLAYNNGRQGVGVASG